MLRVADTRCGLLQVIPVPPVQVILGDPMFFSSERTVDQLYMEVS